MFKPNRCICCNRLWALKGAVEGRDCLCNLTTHDDAAADTKHITCETHETRRYAGKASPPPPETNWGYAYNGD